MEAIYFKILKALRFDYKTYDDYRFNKFCRWCIKNQYSLPLQRMISNENLYNWYCDNWIEMVERPFYHNNKEFIDSEIDAPDNYMMLFEDYTSTINEYYPSTLLNHIKRDFKQQLKQLK